MFFQIILDLGVDETYPYPTSFTDYYGQTKAEAEQLVKLKEIIYETHESKNRFWRLMGGKDRLSDVLVSDLGEYLDLEFS